MSEIERAGGGDVERRRNLPYFQMGVYALALVGVWSIVRFVMGTLTSLFGIALIAGVVVLLVVGVRAFLKGPPDTP
jgi:CHASE2 domain-containing sensor protein